jgi:UTP--glucose-1-phosphate uridylyltransferase
LEEFKSVRKFKIFNTNNLWLNLPALKRVMETENLDLEIIINQKSLDDGQPVIQLETAAGAAIKHFKGAHGVNVPRNRFLPVKSCSDLLLIKSDIYSLEHGQLVINPSRMFENTPVIKLGDHFKKVSLSSLAPMKSLLSFTTRQYLTFFFSFLRRSNSSRSGSRRSPRSLS